MTSETSFLASMITLGLFVEFFRRVRNITKSDC
jgi:hypothetical protein